MQNMFWSSVSSPCIDGQKYKWGKLRCGYSQKVSFEIVYLLKERNTVRGVISSFSDKGRRLRFLYECHSDGTREYNHFPGMSGVLAFHSIKDHLPLAHMQTYYDWFVSRQHSIGGSRLLTKLGPQASGG